MRFVKQHTFRGGRALRFMLLLGTLLLGAEELSAQHYIGVMGGWGGGSARFKPTKETGYEWGLYTGGLSYKFYSETKYVGGIEVDLLFTQKGFNYDLAYQSDSSYHRRVNAVEIPLIWQPHFYMFQRHVRLFINLGIQFSYNINSSYKYVSKKNGVYESGSYTMQLNRDNRFSYGLCGGGGLAFLLGHQRRFEFSVEARYSYGYGDILRNSNKYKTNPERSALDNINVLGALYYRIGKGGIRSTPSAAATLRMEEQATRHILNRLDKMQQKGTLADSVQYDSTRVRRLVKDNLDIPMDSVVKQLTTLDSLPVTTAPNLTDSTAKEAPAETTTKIPSEKPSKRAARKAKRNEESLTIAPQPAVEPSKNNNHE